MLRKILKFAAVGIAALVLVIGGLIVFSGMKLNQSLTKRYELPPLNISTDVMAAQVELGERIVQVRNGCVDCHGKDLAGAKVVDDPVAARIYGSNLTPFALADWSDDEVAQAIRYGIKRNGTPAVLMPAHEYQHLSRGDLAAIVAYLRTVPAVEKPTIPIEIGPLFKVLYTAGKLPTLLPTEIVDQTTHFPTKPAETLSTEFGKYLVTSSCTGCHGADLAGGPIPGGPPEWPPASDLRANAIGKWTEDDFIKAMRTGQNPAGKTLRAPMPIQLTQKMDDTELKSMWAYLTSQ